MLDSIVPIKNAISTLAYNEQSFASSAAVTGTSLVEPVFNAAMRLDTYPKFDGSFDKDGTVVHWVHPPSWIRTWFKRFQAVVPVLRRTIVSYVLDASYEAVNAVPALPKTEHFLSDTMYNKALVKRHSLSDVMRQRLGDDMAMVKSVMDHLLFVYGEFKLLPGIAKDGEFSTRYALIDDTYSSIRKLSVRVVAAGVIQESADDAQKSDATKIMRTRAEFLTKTLASALEAIINPAVVAPKKLKARAAPPPKIQPAKKAKPAVQRAIMDTD